MKMSDYLKEIQFAVDGLIPIIWGERERLSDLEAKVNALAKVVQENYRRSEFIVANAEDPDDVMLATGMLWENYFGDDKQLYHKDKERKELVDLIVAHALSVGSLSGSLLQHAKQGISLVHGGLANCPNGRPIGSQNLKDVIWQGRNQAIHWEEGKPRQPVQECFDKLRKDFGAKFADYKKRNMAADVVDVLGWQNFDRFRDDMLSLS